MSRLDVLRERIRTVDCSCGAEPGEPCPDCDPEVHLARMTRARQAGLITRADFHYGYQVADAKQATS